LIREEPDATLESLTAKETKVGLITWLGIFPYKNDFDNIVEFLNLAHPLLKKGGAVMISTQTSGYDNEYIEGGIDFIRAGKAGKNLVIKLIFLTL